MRKVEEKVLEHDEVVDVAAKALANVSGAQSYSGRFMFGDKCIGIVTEKEALTRSEIVEEVKYELDYRDALNVDNFNEVLQFIFRQERSDSFGLDTVIYFPQIPDTYVEKDYDEDYDE